MIIILHNSLSQEADIVGMCTEYTVHIDRPLVMLDWCTLRWRQSVVSSHRAKLIGSQRLDKGPPQHYVIGPRGAINPLFPSKFPRSPRIRLGGCIHTVPVSKSFERSTSQPILFRLFPTIVPPSNCDCAQRQAAERTDAQLPICQPWQMNAMPRMSSAGKLPLRLAENGTARSCILGNGTPLSVIDAQTPAMRQFELADTPDCPGSSSLSATVLAARPAC